MAALKFVWRLVWSPVGATIAAVYLAVEGLVDETERSGGGIVAAAAFLAVSSTINYIQDQSLAQRMARTNLRITQRLTALIGSLGEISGNSSHPWKVDLYTAHWRGALSSEFPWLFRKRLIKQASVSLVSTVGIVDHKDLIERGPLGRSFVEQRQLLWLHPQTSITNGLNCYEQLDPTLNDRLAAACGAMRIVPVVSHLDADCVGVLAVHVEPQIAPRLAGTIVLPECARRLRAAALDLHQIIRS